MSSTTTRGDATALQTVQQLVAGMLQMRAQDIDPEADLRQLGLNSIDLIDIISQLEARWQVLFDPSSLDPLTCLTLVQPHLARLEKA
jgi:acyl carrier protein